jgi:hypothetical protein
MHLPCTRSAPARAKSYEVTGSFEGKTVVVQSRPSPVYVSPLPGVVFQDTTFAPADWAVTAVVEPATAGPTYTVEQTPAGGNPGAHRTTRIAMVAGPSRLHLFQTHLPATYNPATQGAAYVIDFSQDCLTLPGTLGVGPQLLVEQNNRRYLAGGPTLCGAATWSNRVLTPGTFVAADFAQITGPACGAGQACPDFSATGAPLRFGFANFNEALAGIAGASGGLGVDNWRVTVWRR